ncbi:signal recognition particle protein Srp19, partial [Candidatus Bathyarchaeota archaeon]
MRKLENKCIVWLTYFDASKTYGKGRKVPKRFALNSPRMEELVKAAEILNLN